MTNSRTWTNTGGEPERAVTPDEMLDNISLYWFTNTGTSSSQLYWDVGHSEAALHRRRHPERSGRRDDIFPGEIYQAPRSWAEQNFHKLIYLNGVDKGGHFAAWEQPELFSREIRAAFKSLRQST